MKAFLYEYKRYLCKIRMPKGQIFSVKSYNGKKLLNFYEANDFIAAAIERGEPFMAARYGSVELAVTWKVRDDGKGFIDAIGDSIYNNAGFFPKGDDSSLIKFSQLMKQSTSRVNLMGVWFNPMEEYELRTYGSNPEYCRLGHLESVCADNPWSAKLEGKKVLVIHPFEKSIRSQYARRELLFPGRNVLPEFKSLEIVKAVQTIAGNRDERFSNWFEALDYMYNEAMSKDFDVAIIGCGAYGFPLAAKIKEAGKIAIHLGGATQLLFGIRGDRWESQYKGSLIEELMKNENWVRPLEEEKPSGFKTIENGCYW